MIVKVCGITIAAQFNWLSQQPVDMIGLNFYRASKRYFSQPLVGIEANSKVEKVGIFVNPELSYLLEKVAEYNLSMVQLHGHESAAFCEDVASHVAIIKAFGVDDDFLFTDTIDYLNCCRYFLFDTRTPSYGGSGKKFNWHKLSEYHYDKPFLLSGGIQPDDIQDIIDLNFSSLAGIDINSGFEISPGIKDLEKIKKMLKLITNEES